MLWDMDGTLVDTEPYWIATEFELAERYGTPLYVLDEAHLRANCAAYREALARCCRRSQPMYAGKALLTTAVARIVATEGLGIDVSCQVKADLNGAGVVYVCMPR